MSVKIYNQFNFKFKAFGNTNPEVIILNRDGKQLMPDAGIPVKPTIPPPKPTNGNTSTQPETIKTAK